MSPFGLFPHTAKNMDAPIQPPKRPYYDKKRLGIRVYQGEQRLRTILRPHTLAYMRSSVELTQPEVSRVELFPRPEPQIEKTTPKFTKRSTSPRLTRNRIEELRSLRGSRFEAARTTRRTRAESVLHAKHGGSQESPQGNIVVRMSTSPRTHAIVRDAQIWEIHGAGPEESGAVRQVERCNGLRVGLWTK